MRYAIIEYKNNRYHDIAFSNSYNQLAKLAEQLADENNMKLDCGWGSQPNTLKFYSKKSNYKLLGSIELVETISREHGKIWWK